MTNKDFQPTPKSTAILAGALVAAAVIVTAGWASEPPAARGTQPATGDQQPVVAAAGDDLGEAPLPPYTDFLRFAGSTLRPRRNDVSYANSSQGGCLYATAGSTSTWFNLSVELPDGALVEYVRMYADDSSASANCAGYFTVYDLYGNLVEEHGMLSSGSSGPAYWTTEELALRIDYSTYSYVLNWRPNVIGSEMQLCGFRIYYSMP